MHFHIMVLRHTVDHVLPTCSVHPGPSLHDVMFSATSLPCMYKYVMAQELSMPFSMHAVV